MARMIRAILLASATAASFFDLTRQQGQQPQRSAARLGGADHRGRPDHQQAPQIFVAGAADPTELLSPGGRVSRGVMPIQEAKCRPERKACGSATLRAKLTPAIGPIPGIVAKHWLVGSCRCQAISCFSIVFNLTPNPSS